VLEEHRPLLPGLVLQSEPRRLYPMGRAVAHVVGYVGEVTEQELDANRFRGASSGSIVGRSGIERQYDDTLRGREGVRYIEVNARGGLVREQASVASLSPVAGRSLHTTIDLDLQRFIDSIWPPGVRGAMIAMAPTGEIRALYSAPTYDPNVFVGGIGAADYRALLRDSANPLLNRALYGRYPPASPFKLATAAMGLRRKEITLDSHMPIPCRGGLRLGNRVFKCWDKRGHGSLDLIGAVAKSCDVYFYQLGQRLGLLGDAVPGPLRHLGLDCAAALAGGSRQRRFRRRRGGRRAHRAALLHDLGGAADVPRRGGRLAGTGQVRRHRRVGCRSLHGGTRGDPRHAVPDDVTGGRNRLPAELIPEFA